MEDQPNLLARREDQSRVSGLLRMPPELIAHITEYLEREDFCKLRLTNKTLNYMSIDAFGTRFFRSRLIRLNLKDLQRLIHIAGHPVLGAKVQELRIWMEYHYYIGDHAAAKWIRYLERKGADEEQLTQAEKASNQFLQRVASVSNLQKEFRNLKLACSFLTHAMGLLKNLQAVIHSTYDWEFPNPLEEIWWETASPELKAYNDEMSKYLDEMKIDWGYGEHLFHHDLNTVLSAIIGSGSNIQKLAFDYGTVSVRRHPGMNIPKALSFHDHFKDLRTFEISFHNEDKPDTDHMFRILVATPAPLEELKIEVRLGDEPYIRPPDSEEDDFLPFFDKVFKESRWRGLRKLEITSNPSSAKFLPQFLRLNHATLRHIDLQFGDPGDDPFIDPTLLRLKWSEVFKACLGAPQLKFLKLRFSVAFMKMDIDSGSFTRRCNLESFVTATYLGSSPNDPERARLEAEFAKLEDHERELGLDDFL
ncbi:hypothetical protein IWZ00DRAFT_540084 [Phyllosticta capitalensis]